MDVFNIIKSLNSIVKSSLNDSIEIKVFLIELQSQIQSLIDNSSDESTKQQIQMIAQHVERHIRSIEEDTKTLVKEYKTISAAALMI